jgi:septum formation protein
MVSSLILASKSPRRQELLKLLQIPFSVLTVETEEHFDPSLSPERIVMSISEHKAAETLKAYPQETRNQTLLSADTTVVLDGEILNKPASEDDAFRMLTKLQGRTHRVYTGFTLRHNLHSLSDYEATEVTFSPMTSNEITAYIHIAKPFDKAGSYGIQDDYGACFIEKINGCYYNVVGLPLSKLYCALKQFSTE